MAFKEESNFLLTARTRKAFLAEETVGTQVAKMTEAIGIDGGEDNLGLL